MRRFAIIGLAAASLALGGCDQMNVAAGDGAGELADRIAIEDLLTEYYSHFGGSNDEDFAQYYTEDAVFDVNGRVATGREAIVGIYEGLADPGTEEGAAAAAPPPPSDDVFHMLLSNVQVDVEGDTATVKLYWTGILNTDPFGPPTLQEHGREYDLLVKQDGKWLIKHRVVIADSAMPESFRETYQPRLDFDIKAAQ
jgi:uncharacterized protein (TIGR02246 family)